MRIQRVWAMPSIWTFRVKPIAELLARYVDGGRGWADPFAGEASPAELTNDIEGRGAAFTLDGLEFLKQMPEVTGVLFDPPYSTEQCLRRYTPKFKGTAGRAEYWARCKEGEVCVHKVSARGTRPIRHTFFDTVVVVTREDGLVINSGGFPTELAGLPYLPFPDGLLLFFDGHGVTLASR